MHLADGSSVEADVIVCATGYRMRFPFFDDDETELHPDSEHRYPLFKRMIKPGIDHLFFMGLAQSSPTIVNLAEQQSKLLAGLLTGTYALPPMADQERIMREDEQAHLAQYYAAPRHTIQIDFGRYVVDLLAEIEAGEQSEPRGMTTFVSRFDFRAPGADRATRQELFSRALEQAAYLDEHGHDAILVSEHHASDDGYLPSPLVVAAAVAARTTRIPITVSALLVNFYDPVKLAEDVAVLDNLSAGRVSYTIGLGYRPEEYALFDQPWETRGADIERRIELLLALWRGEQVEHDGRQVSITPLPFSDPHPFLFYGGGSPAAARRAAGSGSTSSPTSPTGRCATSTSTSAAGTGASRASCCCLHRAPARSSAPRTPTASGRRTASTCWPTRWPTGPGPRAARPTR